MRATTDRTQRPTPEQLATLAPLPSLSRDRLQELAGIGRRRPGLGAHP